MKPALTDRELCIRFWREQIGDVNGFDIEAMIERDFDEYPPTLLEAQYILRYRWKTFVSVVSAAIRGKR